MHTLLGFIPFEYHYKIIPVFNGFFCTQKCLVTCHTNALLEKLDAEHERIVLDHQNLKCKNILFEINGEYVLCIYTIFTQKHYGFSIQKIFLHYISDINFFNKNIKSILKAFGEKIGFMTAIYVDKRIISNRHVLISVKKKINPPKIYSNPFSEEIEIDSLYSEAILL